MNENSEIKLLEDYNTSKEIIQSYVLTSAKYDFNIYEKRILYRLVQFAQRYLEENGNAELFKISKDLFETRRLELPLKYLVDSDKKDHRYVKDALESLRKKSINYTIKKVKNKETTTITLNTGILTQSEFHEGYSRKVILDINKVIWEVIFDFSKGFSIIDLEIALQLKSVYSMRFYELLNNNNTLTFSIESLKKMFLLETKYDRFNDFEKRVIKVAQEELKKINFHFTYHIIREKKTATHITFFPPEKVVNVIKTISPSWYLKSNEIDYLTKKFGFTIDELKRHNEVFQNVSGKIDLLLFLTSISDKILRSDNPKGYIISALKNKINNLNKHYSENTDAINKALSSIVKK